MWTYLSISAFAWGQARYKLGGVDTSILHHSFILLFIVLWAVITHYIIILMPFLSYFIRFTWRGRMPAARKGANIRDLFCTTPKVLKLHGEYFWIYKKYWVKKVPEGATRGPGDRGAPSRGGRAPHPPGQGVGPLMYFFCSIILINSKNDFREVSGLLELCRIGL